MEWKFLIPVTKIEKAKKLVNRLEKKARSTGSQIEFIWGEEKTLPVAGPKIYGAYHDPETNKLVMDYRELTVKGNVPKIEGYRLLGFTKFNGVTNVFQGFDDKFDPSYDTTDFVCDHCHSRRDRKFMFVLENEKTGEIIKVGKNCLDNYVPLKDIEAIFFSATLLDRIEDFIYGEDEGDASGGYGSYGPSTLPLATVVAMARDEIKQNGFKPSAHDDATKFKVMTAINRSQKEGFKKEHLKKEAEPFLNEVREYVKKTFTNPNNAFEANIRNVFKEDEVAENGYAGLGIIVWVVNKFLEDKNKVKEQPKNSESEHFASPGDVVEGEMTLLSTKRIPIISRWASSTNLLKFDYNGNIVTVFTNASNAPDKVGRKYFVRGKVKDNRSFNGIKETVIRATKFEETE